MEKLSVFLHQFDSPKTICQEFGIPEETLNGCHVYLAYYHIGDYGCDSSAYVLFEEGGQLFEVHGGHCSCHGLSERDYSGGSTQWDPEEVTVEYLNHQMKSNGKDCGLFYGGGYDDDVKKAQDACKAVMGYLNEHF